MTERTYSEKEIAVLLERAAELQALAAKSAEHRPGLTLDELESVASEAGLDPSLLRKAAAELDQPQHALLHQNSGMTTAHVFVERRVPGTLTPELWEDVVAELRHHFDSDLASMMGMAKYGIGTTEQIGRTLEWRHTSMSGIETKLMIRPREDQLDVRMSQRVGWASPPAEGAGYGLIVALVLGMIGGAILDSAGMGVAIFLVSSCRGAVDHIRRRCLAREETSRAGITCGARNLDHRHTGRQGRLGSPRLRGAVSGRKKCQPGAIFPNQFSCAR